MEITNQAQFMRQYNDMYRQQFNPEFFERNNQDIMDKVKKVILSCHKDRYFTLDVLEMREVYDYEEVYNILWNYTNDQNNKKKSKNRENIYDYIDIKDSDLMLLVVKYFVRHNGVEKVEVECEDPSKGSKTTKDVINPYEVFTSVIALPRFRRKYYFRLNGNYYTCISQIVDGSTYNNAATGNSKQSKKTDCNTFKTLFAPVKLYRKYKDMVDINSKSTIRNTVYVSFIGSNFVDCILYILANYGFYGTCRFLNINCITITDYPITNPEYYCFQKHSLYISYPKMCQTDAMVQSFAATLYGAIGKEATAQYVFGPRYWVHALGVAYRAATNTIDKGLFILDSIDGIYDICTYEALHLPDEKKEDIYQIFRWLMREFYYIHNKDNVDVRIKRRRDGEYIAHVLAMKLNKGIRRISESGKRVTLRSVISAINIDPMYIINIIIKMSNLVAYRDMVNDNDATVALKYTYKGISGLGEDGTSIQRNYRYVDASHAGILDLDASSASDPGMSGMLCPMGNLINKTSFTEFEEPDFWEKDMGPLQQQWKYKLNPETKVPVTEQNPDNLEKIYPHFDYANIRNRVIEQSLDIDRAQCPIFNIFDSSIDYSNSARRIQDQLDKEAARETKSLFTVYKDGEKQEGALVDNGEEGS